MIRIERHSVFGFNAIAPGQPPVWCATRAIAAETAWSLAEAQARIVSPAQRLADSMRELVFASRELTNTVEPWRTDAQLVDQLGAG